MDCERVFRFFAALLICLISSPALAEPKEVTFGGDPDYAPFEWVEAGEPTGLHVELAQAMGRLSGTRVRHRLQPWPVTVEALRKGDVDVVPMFRSAEREKYFWFSRPLYHADHSIYTIGDPATASQLKDVIRSRITVEETSFAHDQLRAEGLNGNLVLVGTTREALSALASGAADYAVLATGPADYLTRQMSGVKRVGAPFWPREYAFAVARDRADIAQWVESSLGRVVAEGTLQELQDKWMHQEQGALWLVWRVIAPGIVVIVAAAGWLYLRASRRATEEKRRRSGAERHVESLTRAAETAEEALRRSEAHLANAQWVGEIGSFEIDLHTLDVMWSEQTYRIFRLSPHEFNLSLPTAMDLFYGEDRTDVDEHLQRALTGEIPVSIEARFVRADGEVRWGAFAAGRLTGPDGDPISVIGTVQDITDRKQAEQNLRESEAETKALIEASPDAFVTTDDRGNVIEWSPQAEVLLGWSKAEALGRSMVGLGIPEEGRAAHTARLSRHSHAAETQRVSSRYELELETKDRRRIPVEVTLVSTKRSDRLLLHSFVRDLRASRDAEERIRQAQKMEAVGQLTGGIAHDFNNLLAITIGNLDLLDPSRLSDEEKELVEEARDASLRGADLTARLLAFARKQTLQPRPVDLNDVVSEYAKLLNRLVGEDVEMRMQLAPNACEAMVDPGQLEVAITNLATNARDAMPKGGLLKIRTRCGVSIEGSASGSASPKYVALDVIDTGGGMSPAVKEKALEPFFTTKEPGRGTGLGLSMVYGFVQQSGGELRIRSGKTGTAVTLLFPLARRAVCELPSSAEESAAAAARGETVLLVEDNESLRRVASRQLESLGYSVLSASDAASALEIVESSKKIELVLTDIIMPGGTNGVELGRKIRELRPEIKLIYVSGYPEGALGERAQLDQEVTFIRKPYLKSEIARRIREVLDGKANKAA